MKRKREKESKEASGRKTKEEDEEESKVESTKSEVLKIVLYKLNCSTVNGDKLVTSTKLLFSTERYR